MLIPSENAHKKGQMSDSNSYKTFQSKPMKPPPKPSTVEKSSSFFENCDKMNNNFDDIPNEPPPLPPRSKISHKEPTFKSFVGPLSSTASCDGDKAFVGPSTQQVNSSFFYSYFPFHF
jgi:hypothetical protein